MKKPDRDEDSGETAVLLSEEETERQEPAATPNEPPISWEDVEEELERQRWLVWEAWRVGLV